MAGMCITHGAWLRQPSRWTSNEDFNVKDEDDLSLAFVEFGLGSIVVEVVYVTRAWIFSQKDKWINSSKKIIPSNSLKNQPMNSIQESSRMTRSLPNSWWMGCPIAFWWRRCAMINMALSWTAALELAIRKGKFWFTRLRGLELRYFHTI